MRKIAIIGLIAAGLCSPAHAQAVLPTKADIKDVIENGQSRSYPEGDIDAWERDLTGRLKQGGPNQAANAIAARYGFAPADMRRLVSAWIVAQARQYRQEAGWKPSVRAELLALAPSARRSPIGLTIIAEALGAINECASADFEALMAGSGDPAGDAYKIASAAPCDGNFARAAMVDPARAMPALIRLANWGTLPLGDTLPLYAWLTSPPALAHVRAEDRRAVAVLLWQRYVAALLKAGLDKRALALMDAWPADLRRDVLAPTRTGPVEVRIDDIPLALFRPQPGRGSWKSEAPILQLAEVLAAAGRETEARSLLTSLPGLDAARATLACGYVSTGPMYAKCPNINELPIKALTLDHLLNKGNADPYPIAEVMISSNATIDAHADAVIRCRVFHPDQFPGLCAAAEAIAANAADLDREDGGRLGFGGKGETSTGRVAIARIVPDFANLRQAIRAEVLAHPAPASAPYTRETVAAVPPPFEEKAIPAQWLGTGKAALPAGLAPLPAGFMLVRAERDGQRAVAISLSQTYDPTGEVSGGGYWVHLSDDGGRHWQAPLYTGLADRFPYVVPETARLPMLAGDHLQFAVDIAEIDTATITYPPVALRTRRRAQGRYLVIPLADLKRDSNGDGLTDIAAHHLLLDLPKGDKGTPFVVGTDTGARCPTSSRERQALIDVLGKLIDPSKQALIEPVDRPEGLSLPGWKRADAATGRPLFVVGKAEDFACFRPRRAIVVYDEGDIAALGRFTPDFHAFTLPPIIFNRAHDRGYVNWSTGWAGGTYRLRWIGEKWVFEAISSWIS
ncbi:hypothetical protein [Sphingomonas sp. MMS24-J13]|uniref:hypothetical protein n=1 Tax=Sphingomonas sp. MMS24-J13 TaxID=3238686 RepID=UPI00384AACB1